MFFEDDDGTSYPMSRVRSVRRDWKNQKVVVELDDQQVTLPERLWLDHLRKTVTTFIASRAGYVLLQAVSGDDGDRFDRQPIVGWAINSLGNFVPVTCDGLAEFGEAILTPEGMVVQPQMGSWANLSEYLSSTDRELSNWGVSPPSPA